MNPATRAFLALLPAATAATAVLATAEDICHCEKFRLFPAPVADKPGRKYARDRLVDIQHLRLEVTPDFARRAVSGTARLTFSPIARPLTTLELDAVALEIESVEAEGATIADRQTTEEKLIMTFAAPIQAGATASVSVRFKAQPARGLYFCTPENGFKPGDTQVWSQGEAELHRFWFPCYDYPNERFSSEVICRVPEPMEVISNGLLVSRQKDEAGLVAWHWRQDKPHVNYLVALAAGYFHKLEDKVGALPLAVFVPPSARDQAADAFRDTKAIIEFFQQEIGVPFPWDKYYQVFCHDFVAGGMENTSCTFVAERLLFSRDQEQLHTLHRLDAHETAHQWFGDLVTCRDWSHLWLNEGFASYYTVLYEEKRDGRDAMLYALWKEARRVIEATDGGDTKPIVWRDYPDPMAQFDYRAYPKAAWVLHMLRHRLGPELFRTGIRTYLERHRGGIVTSDDLQDVLEEVSGLSFDRFFDQWLHHGGIPALNASYSWDAELKSARLTIRQTQKTSPTVPVFHCPLPVRFILKGGEVRNVAAELTRAEEDFYFPLPSQPEVVRIDPEYSLLAKIDFQPTDDMLKAQISGDLIGRLLAVQSLGGKKTDAAAESLARIMNGDAFWGVRSEAIQALRKMNTPAARHALVAAPPPADARVRKDLIEALGAALHDDARQSLVRLQEAERNPELLAEILQALAPWTDIAVASFIERRSYREQVAQGAISALRARDDASSVPAILRRLRESALDFEASDFARALDALAFLARRQPDRQEVRTFLASHLNHPRESWRLAAARALGTLNDPAALALLQPLTTVPKPFKDPVREAAERSIQSIEAQQAGPPELRNIWQRLQELQKKTEDLEGEVDKLRKKPPPPATAKPAQ